MVARKERYRLPIKRKKEGKLVRAIVSDRRLCPILLGIQLELFQ
jgi:hypothetical protein